MGCQTITLVIPPGTSPLFDADARLDDLEVAARNVPGDRHYEDVTVFVSPADLGGVDGFVPNFGSDVVIADEQYAVHPSILWIHEYVHTHQRDTVGESMRWSVEGSANYLAYEIALENGRISPLYYDSLLGQGAGEDWDRPLERSGRHEAAYARGPVVLAAMDRDLRTYGNQSVDDLFVWLNENPNTDTDELRNYLLEEGELPEERAEHYDAMVGGDESVAVPYAYGFSEAIPEQAWYLNVLLLPFSRLLAAGFLALVGVTMAGKLVYRRLSRGSTSTTE